MKAKIYGFEAVRGSKSDERIAALESELRKKQATISRLLSDDVRSSEDIAELQELVWQFHRGLKQNCNCYVCTEVERGQKELEGLF